MGWKSQKNTSVYLFRISTASDSFNYFLTKKCRSRSNVHPCYKRRINGVKGTSWFHSCILYNWVLLKYFVFQYVKSEEFPSNPFWFRIFYMVPMFQIFRTRLYLAWIMSELMSMTAGLGAYPVDSKPRCGEGPTDLIALKHWWDLFFLYFCLVPVQYTVE